MQEVSEIQAEQPRLRRRAVRALPKKEVDPVARRRAMRTAFVARFVVLREGRRTRAHRMIEQMIWDDETTAEELMKRFRDAFVANGDKLQPVDRDLRRAMEHCQYSADYFIEQYCERSVLSFHQALEDYARSLRLLFGEDPDNVPRSGGWRLPGEEH